MKQRKNSVFVVKKSTNNPFESEDVGYTFDESKAKEKAYKLNVLEHKKLVDEWEEKENPRYSILPFSHWVDEPTYWVEEIREIIED